MVCAMNTTTLSSLFLPARAHKSLPLQQWSAGVLFVGQNCSHHFQPEMHYPSLRASRSVANVSLPSGEGMVSVVDFEEFVEKDWSFLDIDEINTPEIRSAKIDKIISAGEALIKEKYDQVKCWQGELIYAPEKWTPFDVVFLYFFPGLPFQLDQIFETLSLQCLPGARVVISHPQGRAEAEQQRQQYPDVVSDLPDKTTLQRAAAAYSLEVVEYVDEVVLYLAVLKYTR